MFLHAAGHWRLCETELEAGDWHGDHVTPFSHGGATGQALCAACNLRKSNRATASESK